MFSNVCVQVQSELGWWLSLALREWAIVRHI